MSAIGSNINDYIPLVLQLYPEIGKTSVYQNNTMIVSARFLRENNINLINILLKVPVPQPQVAEMYLKYSALLFKINTTM